MKRLLSYFRAHRGLFVIDLACAFLVGLCDEFLPLIVRNMINIYVPRQDYAMMVRWTIVLAMIYTVKFVLNLIITYWGHVFGVRVQADMRRDIFHHIERLPIAWFDDHKTGEIMSRITNDLQEISEMSHHGPENLFTSAIMLGVSAVMLGRINLRLTMIVYACLPLAAVFLMLLRKGQMAAFARTRKEIAAINGEAENSIAGVRITRSFGGRETEERKFADANRRYTAARSAAYRYLALFSGGMTLFTDLMYAVVILFGGNMFFHGELNGGDFVAYLLYISMFLTPIKKLVETYEQIAEGMSGVHRFEEIMNLKIEEDDPGAEDIGELRGEIQFDHVSFHYGGEEQEGRKVIEDLNLHIDEQMTVGLVGESGGGKTTICNLIPRFYEIDSGRILIDGIDIRKMTRDSLRRNIGIVAQDVFLFHGTVRENIAYGRPDATEEEIIEAARKARIHDDIMEMEHGYDSEVGERGVHLSGGQRQRISIARVFLKNPRILILDEATSALDNATEMAIQESLDQLSEGRTVIIVAHRLSTMRNASQILVVTKEGIAERGSKEELLQQNGIFRKLYEYQFETGREEV
ncbi:MAG: ABC transporter ATP-binding protein [Solobacterium sp.]|nr:ABC transporter ATP-binding protein [Solobacterium sp.]